MSDRIKELALKAFRPINDIASEGIADFYTFNQAWFRLYNQSFAELIIRECAQLARDTDLEDVEGGDQSVLCAAKMQILKHFDIKE